ncbi:Vacuolar transporter chaperone 4 [Hondaea fermentalgiana]|uniref:Vacuolar transporter chaperone 4 n=1 Tax=Hondaea fermentalgiana TaxID=2315210 RepID=A0A2R5G644_9STRA|nr:Vacuolar transporter chaperone 4 [Hondaea fermentalgiana]|eukprot:GBG26005.1 Vacuolar transporter chaperone 4 [Hondaea fermentalgiana]
MKFGQYLEAQRVEGWEAHYLDYRKLKSMIKALAEVESTGMDVDVGKSGYGERVTSLSTVPNQQAHGKFEGKDISEADFFTELEAEMKKIDDFTHGELQGIKKKTDTLESRVGVDSDLSKLSDTDRKECLELARTLGDDFLRIEKFANLNFLGFHKILKKHDKQLPTPCRRFYLTRLHNQRWVKHDYSKVFVFLSQIHARLRGDQSGKNEGTTAQNFVRSTTKYWVRTEDISKVKHIVLQHLPVFQHNLDDLQGDSQFCSSVYFDNTQLELYHGRLDKTPNAIAIRFRWYATPEPDLVFVERKTHRDSWTGDVSVKERFTLREHEVMPFLRGEFTVDDKMAQMRAKNSSEADMANVRRLFTEIYQQIDSKQLRPTMRTVYNRVAYQIPFDATVRISLDTNLTMISENPKVGPDCATEKRWYRNPNLVLPPTEYTVFPHSVLEVKLSLKEGEEAPAWVSDLIESGLCTRVAKFSKFVHGVATLLSEEVQAVPYWVDDESIRPSMLRSQPVQKRRSLLDEGHGGSSSAKYPFAFGPAAPIQLMERKASVIGKSQKGYGTLNPSEHHPLSGRGEPDDDFVFVPHRPDGFISWILSPCFGSSNSANTSKPRKLPTKVEPKVFFANERTLLNWLSMAITMGSISAALLGFGGGSTSAPPGADTNSIGHEGSRIIGMLLLPVAIVFIAYALATYYWRGKNLHARQGEFHDEVGPFLLGIVLMISLSTIFFLYLFEGATIRV